MDKCRDCKFYQDGECHAHPPVGSTYIHGNAAAHDIHGTGVWPKTDGDRDGCGEFKN
jgi:hypothetical protein